MASGCGGVEIEYFTTGHPSGEETKTTGTSAAWIPVCMDSQGTCLRGLTRKLHGTHETCLCTKTMLIYRTSFTTHSLTHRSREESSSFVLAIFQQYIYVTEH